jgi:dTDP-4-dehydrorhamnose reductase
VERSAGRRPLEHTIADPVRERPRILVTGAGGQLGRALCETFADADLFAFTHEDWDVAQLPPRRLLGPLQPDLVLHAAAWTDVDAVEGDPDGAREANVDGTRHVVMLGAPVVYFSSDYVFDGEKGEPYVETDAPRPLSVYGQTKLDGEHEVGDGWIVRTSWLFAPWGHNFLRTMLALGAERDEVAVVDDQRGCPTYVAHLAEATRAIALLPHGAYHVAGGGDCTWAEFAEAIFEEAGLDCRVRRVSTEELARPALRPAYSVLHSEKPETPRLPHWREGLRDCLARLPG